MIGSSRSPIGRTGSETVLARLKRFAPLCTSDEALLRGLNDWRRDPVNVELVREMATTPPRFLVSGWAARVRWLMDGRRQIIGFVVPGDGLGLCRRPQPMAMCAVVALTPVQTLDAMPVMRAIAGRPDTDPLSLAINIAAAMDEAWLMDQVVRLGRLTAHERISHLILELHFRLSAIGQATATHFSFPLTQEQLADASGLSIVHVNRTLQQLRREKLIELSHGRMTLLEPQALADIADFRQPQPSGWVAP